MDAKQLMKDVFKAFRMNGFDLSAVMEEGDDGEPMEMEGAGPEAQEDKEQELAGLAPDATILKEKGQDMAPNEMQEDVAMEEGPQSGVSMQSLLAKGPFGKSSLFGKKKSL